MTTFYRYLCYRLKSSALRTLIFTVITVMIDVIGIVGCISEEPKYSQIGLYMLATILCVVSSVVPIFELSGLKNRRNLDTLYFFPLRREKMALVHYISGFVQVAFIYTVTYLLHYFYFALQTDYFALVYMLPYYILSLLLALVIYSVYVFIFSQANTVVDGVVFCVFWIFLLWIAGGSFLSVWSPYAFGTEYQKNATYLSLARLPSWGILYTPMNNLTVLYQDLIEINKSPEAWNVQVNRIMEHFTMFFVWGAIGIAAAVGYVISFVKKGAEQAGEISNSWFGYKTLLPICGYCFIFAFKGRYGIDPNACGIYVILMITGYIIYRRGFKFKLSDILLMAGGIIPILLVGGIA